MMHVSKGTIARVVGDEVNSVVEVHEEPIVENFVKCKYFTLRFRDRSEAGIVIGRTNQLEAGRVGFGFCKVIVSAIRRHLSLDILGIDQPVKLLDVLDKPVTTRGSKGGRPCFSVTTVTPHASSPCDKDDHSCGHRKIQPLK